MWRHVAAIATLTIEIINIMATKIAADTALGDSSGIEKVWKANPEVKLGKGDETVTLKDYQGTIK